MTKIANVYVTAQNVGELASFYRTALGLQDKFEDGERWIQFRLGDLNIAISSVDESSVKPGQNAVMTFEVDDLEKAMSAVRAARGSAGVVRDMDGHGLASACRDPEGNAFQLFQRPA